MKRRANSLWPKKVSPPPQQKIVTGRVHSVGEKSGPEGRRVSPGNGQAEGLVVPQALLAQEDQPQGKAKERDG